MEMRHRVLLIAAVVAVVVASDQGTKRIASDALKASPSHSYLGDLLRLQYTENPGAFLSLGAGLPGDVRGWLFKWGIGALLLGVFGFALLSGRIKPLSLVALSLFLGGGLSNLADRVTRGDAVIDFMNVGVGPLRTGVFNVADLCIVTGILLLAVNSLLSPDPRHPRPNPETPQS